MTFAVATFLLALGLMFGAYWLMILRPEQAERLTAVGRLREYKTESANAGLVLAEGRLSSIPFLDRLLHQRLDLSDPIQRLLEEAGLKTTVGAFVLMVAVSAVAGAVAVWVASLRVLLGMHVRAPSSRLVPLPA